MSGVRAVRADAGLGVGRGRGRLAPAAVRLLDGGARRPSLGAAGVPGRAVVDVAQDDGQPARAGRGAGLRARRRRRAGPVPVRPGGDRQDAAGVHGGERGVAVRRAVHCVRPGADAALPAQPHGTSADGAEEFNRLTAAKLLVLDDLGAERDAATDYTRRTLLMLYEARHDAGRRTIWTSNKTPSEVGAFMGDDRLASRIAGRCRVVELAGRDWRLAGRRSHGPAEREPVAAGRGAPVMERSR